MATKRILVIAVLSLGGPLAAGSVFCASLAWASTVSPLPASDYGVEPVCSAPTRGRAACFAQLLVPRTAAARARNHPLGVTSSHAIVAAKASERAYGLRPQDLRSAYFPGEPSDALASEPQTIALVDAYNDLNIEADLKVYDEEFDLPECTAGDGCFEKVNQKGETGNLPFPSSRGSKEESEAVCTNTKEGESNEELGQKEAACSEVERAAEWSGEISLDVEIAHAVCQNCRIVLVEADNSEIGSLEAAENAAVRVGASEISNSWGMEEPLTDSEAFNHPGTVITVATGDSGYLNWDLSQERAQREDLQIGGVNYPASSPHVVAVGGTRLILGGPGGTWSGETVWNHSGGGCSRSFAAPEWQRGVVDWLAVGCEGRRAVADVSADADPDTGVAVYNSSPYLKIVEGKPVVHVRDWATIGGTSLASPIVAAMFALAGGAHGAAYPAQMLYSHIGSALLHDITEGGNGECDDSYSSGCSGSVDPLSLTDCGEGALICNAATGYDGPSGVGTPNGIAAFKPTAPKAPETRSVTNVESESATFVGGLAAEPVDTSWYFEYASGRSCNGAGAKTTAESQDTMFSEPDEVLAQVSGLQPGTEYTACLVAANAGGVTSAPGLIFNTLSPKPVVLGESASGETATTAVLAGAIKQEPTRAQHYYFEYREGNGLARRTIGGEVSLGAGEADVGPEILTGLNPGTVYYYRLVAVDAFGEGNGEEGMFATLTSGAIGASVTPVVFPTMTGTKTLAFSDLSMAKVQHGNWLVVTLTIEHPRSRLKIDVAAPTARRWRSEKKCTPKSIVLARLVRANVAAGRLKLTIPLDANGRRMLRRRKCLPLTVEILVTPHAGRPQTAIRMVMLEIAGSRVHS